MSDIKILTIFGATGRKETLLLLTARQDTDVLCFLEQGGSVLKYVLADPILSKTYRIRIITRDLSNALLAPLSEKGVEIFQADANSLPSLKLALAGTHTVFTLTSSTFTPNAKTLEITQGKNIADAAISAGVSYFIFSTLPNITKISGGKYTQVHHFDAKAEIEEYIRTLPIKSAFYNPGSFMQNFLNALAPQKQPDGTYVIATVGSPETRLPLLDPVGDSGKFVGAILAEPEKYEGKTLCAAGSLYTFEECARIIGQISGKKVVYLQIDESVLRGMVPKELADTYVEMAFYYQDFGYFGPGTEELVQWASENATRVLTGFEEWLKSNPLPSLEA
ncbi:hypothetical protein G7Y89_g13674 [Cudoniella acicularis]|uniref:NmrA-like domain-containing protein n=1 Tax=Cudoniella acicularis TaxID=354080 RepID=A0A8H4VVU3_9HELO|nr:hypothetical protein G7Y89_g13674 [Cudoniella acicularis]